MESIREIFKIGYGPTSSHTMAPRFAAENFIRKHPEAQKFRVTLYGSLAATGKGHMTDKSLIEAMHPVPVEIIWQPDIFLPAHPNGLKFEALGADDQVAEEWTTYSIGGGDISETGKRDSGKKVYDAGTMEDILKWCENNGRQIWEYVEIHEKPGLWDYLAEVWKVMKSAVERGVEAEGVLPGRLNLPRKASSYYTKARSFKGTLSRRAFTFAFALAVSEENAASIAMEHFLGLTCDPLFGLVQIPCIERNAFGAARALDANMYALLSDGHHLVSFDRVI